MIAPRSGASCPTDETRASLASSGIHRHAATSADNANTPENTKAESRPKVCTRNPATSGPAKTPARLMPPKPAIVRPRSSTGTCCVMKVYRESPQKAVPTPAIRRKATAASAPTGSASAMVENATRVAPSSIVVRNPSRIMSVPVGTSAISVPKAAAATMTLAKL